MAAVVAAQPSGPVWIAPVSPSVQPTARGQLPPANAQKSRREKSTRPGPFSSAWSERHRMPLSCVGPHSADAVRRPRVSRAAICCAHCFHVRAQRRGVSVAGDVSREASAYAAWHARSASERARRVRARTVENEAVRARREARRGGVSLQRRADPRAPVQLHRVSRHRRQRAARLLAGQASRDRRRRTSTTRSRRSPKPSTTRTSCRPQASTYASPRSTTTCCCASRCPRPKAATSTRAARSSAAAAIRSTSRSARG